MSLVDKAENKLQWLTGEVEEPAGRATGNKSRHVDQRDQTKADLKDAGEKVEDALMQ